jgi:hypothetical protein
MSQTNPDKRRVRAGNEALDDLLANYQPMNAEVKFLVDSLPEFAERLFELARGAAKNLHASLAPNAFSTILRARSSKYARPKSKQGLLALSIFDLMLVTYFNEILIYCGDKEISSLLVEALLYEATGFETSAPRDDDALLFETHKTRGIYKYLLEGQKKKHITDTAGRLFGKEVAAIESRGSFGTMVAVSPFSLSIRRQAEWMIRFLLHGIEPSDEEREALDKMISDSCEKQAEIFDQKSK